VSRLKAINDLQLIVFRAGILMAQFEVYKDNARLFRWRLRASNNAVIAESGEGYHNRSDCENAVNVVRNEAPKAGLILNNT